MKSALNRHFIKKKALSLLLTFIMAFGYAGLLSGVVGNDLFGTKLTTHADTWDGTYTDSSGFSNNRISSARGFAYFIRQIYNGTDFSGQTVYLGVDVNLNDINFTNVFPYNDGR